MTTSMTKVIERTEGHYEAHEEHHGKDYVWCPECVVVKCECGERMVLNSTRNTCRCGADHAALIQKELASRRRSEAFSLLLDKECEDWRENQDEYLRSEEHYQLELGALD